MQPNTFLHPELITKFPSEVKTLFQIFGEEIRVVGGAVRDLLLQKDVHDFDFCTKYLPDEIVEILTKNKIKAIPTGVKFGTITAVVNGKNFEITTLRKDDKMDGRHCEVEFVSDYFLDAKRRDFTINALYLDSTGLLTDYFDGISDLKNHKVRFIGEATTRIEEDYLRILRFFRFSCRYAKSLDIQGLEACIEAKENLQKLSRERIRAEILKIISATEKNNLLAILKVLKERKIAAQILTADLDIKALETLFKIEKEFQFETSQNLKIAALFLSSEIDLQKFFDEICATNFEKKYFSYLAEKYYGSYSKGNIAMEDLKMLLAFADKNLVSDLYVLSLAKNSAFTKEVEVETNFKFLNKFFLPDFPINGEDVKSLGISGTEVGKALELSKKFWAKTNFLLEKQDIINFLRKNF